jgi:hypothetical protein
MSHGQQPSGHPANMNWNDIFGHPNINVNGQGAGEHGNPRNPTASASFPTGAAVPPPFGLMGSVNEGNGAHQASNEHEGGHWDDDVYVRVSRPGEAPVSKSFDADDCTTDEFEPRPS